MEQQITHINIRKEILNKFHESILDVEDIDGEKKKYPVHRLVLSNLSKYFEVFFSRESPKFENGMAVYKMIIPFSMNSMDVCMKLIYSNENLIQYSINTWIEVLLGLSYFHFPEKYVEEILCAIIMQIELNKHNTHETDTLSTEELILYLRQTIEDYDIFVSSKEQNILEMLNTIGGSPTTKFIFENQIQDNLLIISENAFPIIRDNFIFAKKSFDFRDMVFETDVQRYHFRAPSMDHLFIGVNSRPIGEPKKLNLDQNIEIRENRIKGKEVMHKAKGKIIIFNGLEEPFELPILKYDSYITQNNQEFYKNPSLEELYFPTEGHITSERSSVGVMVECSKINPMTKFKIVLEFY